MFVSRLTYLYHMSIDMTFIRQQDNTLTHKIYVIDLYQAKYNVSRSLFVADLVKYLVTQPFWHMGKMYTLWATLTMLFYSNVNTDLYSLFEWLRD